MNKKIAVTTTSFAKDDTAPMDMLKKERLQIALNDLGRKLSKKETVSLCKGCVGILAGTESYDKDTLTKLAGLKAISRCGVGMENIDRDAARSLGVEVLNTPYGPTAAVAELTIALILNLLRKIPEMDRDMRRGLWNKKTGNLLAGKQVGIIGFGRIGQKVAGLLEPFDCKILYADIITKDTGFERVSLKDLLGNSDIVSIHVSSSGKMIGKEEIEQMKKGAFLVNVSRGEVIDEAALFYALKNGSLAGAALDVFCHEPYSGPLKELNNVILTPHIGSYASEARTKMEIDAVTNLIKILKGAM